MLGVRRLPSCFKTSLLLQAFTAANACRFIRHSCCSVRCPQRTFVVRPEIKCADDTALYRIQGCANLLGARRGSSGAWPAFSAKERGVHLEACGNAPRTRGGIQPPALKARFRFRASLASAAADASTTPFPFSAERHRLYPAPRLSAAKRRLRKT